MRKQILYAVRLAAFILTAAGKPAGAELPLLERYTLDSLLDRRGTVYQLEDASLGGGDAQTAMRFRRETRGGKLSLRVWRHVPRGSLSFALLGERVEIRGYDQEGTVVYSKDYAGLEQEGIHFGDSRSGNWRRSLASIPGSVRKIEVTFYGNYE